MKDNKNNKSFLVFGFFNTGKINLKTLKIIYHPGTGHPGSCCLLGHLLRLQREGRWERKRKLLRVHLKSTKDILCNSFPSGQELLGIPEKRAQATGSRENHGSKDGVVLQSIVGKAPGLAGSNRTQHVTRD